MTSPGRWGSMRAVNSVVLAALGLAAFALAYRVYSRYLALRIFGVDPHRRTPAHEKQDGVDYVPTSRHVLFGHHFTSVAGAAPILGPAIAVIWGWLPALLWIVFGSIFVGAVHDFGCLFLSTRNGGSSVADLTGRIVGPRARLLFLLFVLFLTWIVLAVFAFVIGTLFDAYPASVLPVNIEILVAAAVGYVVHKRGAKLLLPSLLALGFLYFMVWVGVHYAADWRLPGLLGTPAQTWVVLLLVYAFVASVLPVWLLLQPRDFVNSHQLFVGLGALYLGLVIVHPTVQAPAFDPHPQGAGPWFPLLFITVACGAISGFHGLVGSGTTSKQVDNERDTRAIGYGAMLGEGALALMALLACSAGFASEEAWLSHYHDWGSANSMGLKLQAFVNGGATFLQGLPGLSLPLCQAVLAVIVISFAATTLDTATRIQRMIVQELAAGYGIKPLQNTYVASAVAAFSPLVLVFGGTTLPDGSTRAYWTELWPIFGASNQLLGALSLMVLSFYLVRRGRNPWVVIVPTALISGMTILALLVNLRGFAAKEQWLLVGLSVLLLSLAVWLLAEGILKLRTLRRGGAPDEALQ
ncbi:MAG: carbon starvation protein A [Planctomycetota bacterium]